MSMTPESRRVTAISGLRASPVNGCPPSADAHTPVSSGILEHDSADTSVMNCL